MDQVLGTTAGNALEVREALAQLTGDAPEPRLREVTLALAASLLVQGGLARGETEARAAVERALGSGAAAERFAHMVAALGGPSDLVERPGEHLPAAPVQHPVAAHGEGVLAAVDCRAVGLVVTGLGGNRRREDDAVDPAVGLSGVAAIGEPVGPDRPLAVVHARSDADAERAARALRAAVRVTAEAPRPVPPVTGRIA
jgi:thymidine phosphorylase